MSTHRVEVTTIDEILIHPNADRLELAKVKGWLCVVGKGTFKAGDKAVYIPIDSVLSPDVECALFPIGSKVTLSKSRVRTIKLRGAISQGMVATLTVLGLPEDIKIGEDIAEKLGITKYEPPVVPAKGYGNTRMATSRKQTNPNFRKYTDIENFKNFPDLFEDGELVSITEKLHGTNFRCGYVAFAADTFFKKIKKLLGLAPKFEFVYGSRNVQLQSKMFYQGYYDSNVYAKIVKQYNLDKILKEGEVIYGEVVGDGIQKNYLYGCGQGEHKLAIFDVMIGDKYLDASETVAFCNERDLPTTPTLYVGPFAEEVAKNLTDGDSVFEPTQKVREGIVIRPLQEQLVYVGRKILKYINDEYLLKDNSDFH